METETTRQEQVPAIPHNLGMEQYFENMAKMGAIVNEMKESPVLPSEVPTDVNALTKVEFPDGGGILTYMEKYEYPYKGFPISDIVEKIDTVKKIQRGVISSLYHSIKGKKWKMLVLPFFITEIIESYIYSISRVMSRIRLKPKMYCDAIRELHRAFSLDIEGETLLQKERRLQIRDVVCMYLEFDNAYRYRFQDVVVELDKDLLRSKPLKAISTLFRTMQERELQQEVRDTWTLVLSFLPLLLFINRGFRKQLVSVLEELDLSKIALSVEDKQFCETRKDYKFGYK